MRLENISQNLVLILWEITKEPELCKLIYYNDKSPLTKTNLTQNQLTEMITGTELNEYKDKKILPYPFDENIQTNESSQLRIYYPTGDFKNGVIENQIIHFDIVCAKSLWLCSVGYPAIRPYEIMKGIINHFDESIRTIGKLRFDGWQHYTINESFDCIRLQAFNWGIGNAD